MTSTRFDKYCYTFAQTTNKITPPYWLTLSLNHKEGTTLPILSSEKQQEFIEEALQREWQLHTIKNSKTKWKVLCTLPHQEVN